MNFEINISNHGSHFFATSERSITTSYDFEIILKTLQDKFPESEGYKISATFNPQVSYGLDIEKNISEQVSQFLTRGK